MRIHGRMEEGAGAIMQIDEELEGMAQQPSRFYDGRVEGVGRWLGVETFSQETRIGHVGDVKRNEFNNNQSESMNECNIIVFIDKTRQDILFTLRDLQKCRNVEMQKHRLQLLLGFSCSVGKFEFGFGMET